MQKRNLLIEAIFDIIISLPILNKNNTLVKILLGLFKKHNSLYYWLTVAYSKADDLDFAEELLRFGLVHNLESIEITWLLIVVLHNKSEHKNVIELLEKLLNSKEIPKKDISWVSNMHGLLAKAYLYIGNIERARKHIGESQKIANWDLDTCKTMIELSFNHEEKDNVPRILNEYISKYPNLYPPFVWMAEYYDSTGDLSLAESWYEQALLKTEDSAAREFCDKYRSGAGLVKVFYLNYLDLLLKLNKIDSASSLIERYSKLSYKDPMTQDELVIGYNIYQKDFLKAEQLAKRMVNKNKNTWEYLAYLSKIYILMGNFEKSQAFLHKAEALCKNSLGFLDSASEIYMISGDWVSAKTALDKLIEKFPYDQIYRQRLSELMSGVD